MGASVGYRAVSGNAALQAGDPEHSRPRTSWRPLRFYNYSRELGTTVGTTYGFRAECSCGWVGPVRRTVALVRLTIHEHMVEHQ